MLQNGAACYIFERLHHCAFIKFSTDWKITFYHSHKQVWKVVSFYPRTPPFALLCSHNCSVSVLEVCIVRPSFLHQWPLLLLKYSLGQRLCSQCCHSFGRNLMLAFSMLGTAKCHAPWSWLANHLNLHIKLSISAHIDFSGANYTFKFSKEAKIIRLGLRALSFWRVNEYVKLIVLEKATNPHPQLKRELMIFALIPEVNQKKVGASAQHTDRRVKFTLT